MTQVLNLDNEPEFQLGGPAYRLMQRLGLIRPGTPSILRRFVAFLLLTWVPLLILALIEGSALGPTPQESLLFDFATYARFFLAIPLLFLSEVTVGPRLRMAGRQFLDGHFIREDDLPAFAAAVARIRQRREALLPEVVMVGLAFLGAWFLAIESWTATGPALTWRSGGPESLLGLSLAGLWYYLIAVPLLQFFVSRWLWRLIIWSLFLFELSRLDLRLIPTHPDRAAGLGFLGGAHLSLGIFPFAFSCVLSANLAFQIYFGGAPIESFKLLFLVYLVVMVLLILGPLLIFTPKLARARRQGMREYSILANDYNRAFHQKWVVGPAPEDEPLLGSGDIQSLADLGNSFGFIRDMKIFPFSQQQILQIAIVASLPGLPLIFLVMPVMELLNLLAGALL